MAPVDHRLALSRPALPSAPDKKSFSRVSSPILACSVFTSIAGGASDGAPPEPNRPEAASTRWAFQAAIWFGCTSYCCANSASVFSPLSAASATLALKPEPTKPPFRQLRSGTSHSAPRDVLPDQGGGPAHEARERRHQHDVGECRHAKSPLTRLCHNEGRHSEFHQRPCSNIGRKGYPGELRGTRSDLDPPSFPLPCRPTK